MTREELKKSAQDVALHCGDQLMILVDDRSSGVNKPRHIGVADLVARQDAYIDELENDIKIYTLSLDGNDEEWRLNWLANHPAIKKGQRKFIEPVIQRAYREGIAEGFKQAKQGK